MYRKPPWVPWIVLECLEEDANPHSTHSLLAGELRCYLQRWPGGVHQFRPERTHIVDPFATLRAQNHQYADVIQYINSALEDRDIGMNIVLEALHTICVNDGIPLEVPAIISDFPSLVVFLRERGLCHEFDTDLMCKILASISAADLKDQLRTFSNSLNGVDVLQLNLSCNETCSPDYFLAFTFHSTTGMTLGQVLGIKYFLAHFLGIPRHSFSLKRANTGSLVLVWQFPAKIHKPFIMAFEDEKQRTTLYNKHLLTEVKVKHLGQEKIIFCSKGHNRKRKRSDEISSTTSGEDVDIPMKMRNTAELEPHSSSYSLPLEGEGK